MMKIVCHDTVHGDFYFQKQGQQSAFAGLTASNYVIAGSIAARYAPLLWFDRFPAGTGGIQ